MIVIENLSAGYGRDFVLRNFSLSLEAGKIYALIGPSGCGKSTLLKVLAGIVSPSEGQVVCNGEVLRASSRGAVKAERAGISIGYVPQQYGLLAWKTVRENIFLPLKAGHRKTLPPEDIETIVAVLDIANLMNRYPAELSGGQSQRVALARAFISRPRLLLMDEPFSALDAFTAQTTRELFLSLQQKRKVTTLFITHNMLEAATVGQEILVMDPKTRGIAACLENAAFGKEAGDARLSVVSRLEDTFRQVLA